MCERDSGERECVQSVRVCVCVREREQERVHMWVSMEGQVVKSIGEMQLTLSEFCVPGAEAALGVQNLLKEVIQFARIDRHCFVTVFLAAHKIRVSRAPARRHNLNIEHWRYVIRISA